VALTTIIPGKGVQFRIRAPKRNRVQVLLDGKCFPLKPEAHGYFSGQVATARAGSLYKFKLDDDETLYPDIESRFQPEGPHGPSEIVDPKQFKWTDHAWKGVDPQGQIVYEVHLGTFTREGTWNAARAHLGELASIGITIVEVMPIAEFSGSRGWGYDGVDLYAPYHHYGSPDDARRFVDEAHRLGLGVILDVVYNHLGPDGNYVGAFSDDHFTDKYENDWGESIDFSRGGVREFYIANAAYWIEEFHFDGLRLDATQDIHDTSEEHILAAIAKRVREVAGERKVYIVAENEPQLAWMVRAPEAGGYGIDALWNDDFHHAASVAMTGRREAYYSGYRGSAQEFVSSAKYGYLYQGQRYAWQKQNRGAPTFDLDPWNFVAFLQNHDQIANSARGERMNVLTHPALYRAMSALLLLGPATPMLFQGQEFGATTPFAFFSDHVQDLHVRVHAGRRQFLAQFPSLAQAEMQRGIPDPGSPATFELSKLDWSEREKNTGLYSLYKDLLRLRRNDPVLRRLTRGALDGAVLSQKAFLLRYFSAQHGDRLVIVNLGGDLHLEPAPEPLLAPQPGCRWDLRWSSEDPQYGGMGTPPPNSGDDWRITSCSTLLFSPAPAGKEC